MALMTEKRIRHLPVMEKGRLIGVISIGDVVRAVVDEQQFIIDRSNATSHRDGEMPVCYRLWVTIDVSRRASS